jgi:predicted RNA-binding protein with PUA-like domain
MIFIQFYHFNSKSIHIIGMLPVMNNQNENESDHINKKSKIKIHN